MLTSTSRSSSLAVTSSGLSSDVSDAGLPSEKVMASGKNGDDGDLLLFRDGPGACDISAGALRSSSLAVTSSGLSSDVSDAGLPSEKVMASRKNGDDGDLLLFRDGPGAYDISTGAL
ncbi:hypothetical protein Tco_0229162, partial [Tanacetum coccineum]